MFIIEQHGATDGGTTHENTEDDTEKSYYLHLSGKWNAHISFRKQRILSMILLNYKELQLCYNISHIKHVFS